MKKIFLKIVTPTRILYEKNIQMIIVRSIDGDVGFLANHQNLTVPLDIGTMKIIEDDRELIATSLGGFAVVTSDKITLICDNAEWPQEIDPKRAEDAKERAQQFIKENRSSTSRMRAEIALKKALARLSVYNHK